MLKIKILKKGKRKGKKKKYTENKIHKECLLFNFFSINEAK